MDLGTALMRDSSPRIRTESGERGASYSRLPDDLLVRLVQEGEQRAFEAIIDRYGALIAGSVKAKVGNSHDAEEIVQEVFVSALRSIKSVSSRNRLSSWLLRITQRRIADFYGARERRQHLTVLADFHDEEARAKNAGTEAERPGPRELLDRETVFEHVLLQIAQLRPKIRDVVYMRLIEDMTTVEISVRLKEKESAVRMRLMRGLQQLRARLRPLAPARKGLRK